MADTNPPHVHAEDDDLDGCMCDVEFDAGDMLSDVDLPAASGGIQPAGDELGDEEHVDGCDVDFNTVELTTDEDLPVAMGGVAAVQSNST